MVRTLGEEVKEKEAEIVRKNAARVIHRDINQVKGTPASIKRWPWELLQNACDAGETEEGYLPVKAKFILESNRLVFEHSGGPFETEDLGSLILAGSFKELKPRAYGGRFGTGFFVTHILSEKVTVQGIAKRSDKNTQAFQFHLDRSGNIENIERGIENAYQDLSKATPLNTDVTRYEYPLEDSNSINAAQVGLKDAEALLPYVIAFVPHLKSVEIIDKDGAKLWEKGEEETDGGATIVHIIFCIVGIHNEERRIVVIKYSSASQNTCCAVAANVTDGQVFEILPLSESTPKLFCPQPLLGKTERIGVPVVLLCDQFAPTKEREEILLSSDEGRKNRALVKEAVATIPLLTELAAKRGWANAHLLARISLTKRDSGVTEADFWNEQSRSVLDDLLKREIVATSNGKTVCPIEVSLPVPLLKYEYTSDKPSTGDPFAEQIWSLVAEIHGKVLPTRDLVDQWQFTVRQWNQLRNGNTIDEVVDLEWFFEQIREHRSLTKLCQEWFQGKREVAVKWLERFYALVDEFEKKNNVGIPPKLWAGAVPNQTGKFKSLDDLSKDADISNEIKDIAEELEWLIREELLERSLSGTLGTRVQKKVGQEDVITKLVSSKLNWKEGDNLGEDRTRPASKLLIWLALDSKDWQEQARKMPVLTLDNVVRRTGNKPILLAPTSTWESPAQQFKGIFEFEKSRFLSESYIKLVPHNKKDVFIRKLVEWGIIFKSLLVSVDQVELSGKELDSILKVTPLKPSKGNHQIKPITPQSFLSTIPFLNPEIIGAMGQDPDTAKHFARFLLDFILIHDTRWSTPTSFQCSCGTSHELYPAEWLACLKTKAWVPPEGEELDNWDPTNATAESIKNLLGTSLQEFAVNLNGIKLLRHFGFGDVNLQIIRLTGGQPNKEQDLASVLENVKQEHLPFLKELLPAMKTSEDWVQVIQIKKDRDNTREIVHRNQELGKVVEEIVKAVFRDHGFAVISGYVGYDFQARYRGDVDDYDLGAIKLQSGAKTFFVEVKATRDGDARMTSAQKEKAIGEKASYILCVVDLKYSNIGSFSGLDEFRAAVEENIYIISDIGDRLDLLGDMPFTPDIEMEIAGQLRYRVKHSLWEQHGLDLTSWILTKVVNC